MDLEDMRERVTRFMRANLDEQADVTHIEPGPGHAGFSYLFDVQTREGLRQFFMRLPPPNVKWEGTADVLRQVTSLNALKGSPVPHAPVLWSGDDLQWFDCPYFIQPRVEGDVLRGDYLQQFNQEQRHAMARQAMTALAEIHRVDWQEAANYLGEFPGFEWDVTRWDRFVERAAEPQYLELQPEVRQRLLNQAPQGARLGIFHGDFQWANLMYSEDGKLQAVIDWELTGIGPTLNDVGWICAFNDPTAWPDAGARGIGQMPQAEELESMYREAWGEDIGDLKWFKALAVYKFGIITGLNLSLHRRGKRHDPHWEDMAPGMQTNMEYAMRMLGG